MHAYRDAIRNGNERHAVRFAAILYPGATKFFGSEVAALRSQPLGHDELGNALTTLLVEPLQPLPLEARQ